MAEEERSTAPAMVTQEDLEFMLTHVVRLLTAISCCMALVVVTVNAAPKGLLIGDHLPFDTPFPDTDEQETFTRATNAVGNAAILLVRIIITSVLVVTLYYYRFYRVIRTWIALPSAWILVEAPVIYIKVICGACCVRMDIFSAGLFVYNFMSLGLVVIRLKGPLVVQQFYLIVESSFTAFILIKFLPAWTLWVLLCFVPVWDLVAVLASFGPLRILVEASTKRKEELHDGLTFSTASEGIKMGLGDLIFYSVLVGKVSTYGDRTIVFASFVGILMGVCVTICLAAFKGSAVPALPVSLAFSLIFASFQNVIQCFTNELLAMKAFI